LKEFAMEKDTKYLIQFGSHGILTASEIFGFCEMLVRHLEDNVLEASELGLLTIVILVFLCTQILIPIRGDWF
jgi:hypothetical protein